MLINAFIHLRSYLSKLHNFAFYLVPSVLNFLRNFYTNKVYDLLILNAIAQKNFKLPRNRTDDAPPPNASTPECCGQANVARERHLLDFWIFLRYCYCKTKNRVYKVQTDFNVFTRTYRICKMITMFPWIKYCLLDQSMLVKECCLVLLWHCLSTNMDLNGAQCLDLSYASWLWLDVWLSETFGFFN